MLGINFLKDIITASTNLVRKRILFFSLFAVSVKAQLENASMIVVNPMNTTGSSIIPYAIQQANNGHLWSAGTAVFSPDVDQDLFFNEFANGTQLSTIRLGTIGYDVVNQFITFNDSLVFTGWRGDTISSYNQALIGELSIDSKTLSWLMAFGGNNTCLGRSVVKRNEGGYALGGETSSFGAGGTDGMICAFDRDRNLLWANTVGEVGEEAFVDMIKTSDGGYAGVGSTTSFTAGGYDMSAYKFSSNGNLLWSRTVGGIADDYGASIVELTNSHLKIVGFTRSFGAVGQAIVVVEFGDVGNLVSGQLVDDIGDEYSNNIQKTTEGVRLGGYTTSYGIGNPQKKFIVELYDNNTLFKATTIDGSGTIYDIVSTNNGGYTFTGVQNQGGVVGESDIYGEFPSNCTTRVTPSVIDITANITVRTPNITAVPFTPTIFNVTFTQKAAPVVVENPCVFTTPSPAPVPTPTPTPTTFSILSSLTSVTTTLVTSISPSVASANSSSSSTISSVMQTSNPIAFNVIATTEPIVIESEPTVLPINAFSFTGNVNPEQLVYTVLGNNPNVVITVNGIITNTFTQSDVEGRFVSIALDGVTCGYSGNLQFEASIAGSNTQPQQVNVPLLFDGTTCTTANAGRLLVFSRKQESKQAARPVESCKSAPRFKR